MIFTITMFVLSLYRKCSLSFMRILAPVFGRNADIRIRVSGGDEIVDALLKLRLHFVGTIQYTYAGV